MSAPTASRLPESEGFKLKLTPAELEDLLITIKLLEDSNAARRLDKNDPPRTLPPSKNYKLKVD
eukprot:m.165252 g.165252  ORF g.165252 m.165252 type:complete len:64 (-) comp53112_c0_seq1:2-193(-)